MNYVDHVLKWWYNKQKFNSFYSIVYIIKGDVMNETYKLYGNNAYSDDLTIISVVGIDLMS